MWRVGPVSVKTIAVNGTRIAYVEQRTGTAVIFFHGFPAAPDLAALSLCRERPRVSASARFLVADNFSFA